MELQSPIDEDNEPKIQLYKYIPIIVHCSDIQEPSGIFKVDDKARRVCTYLRAYSNGMINRKFQKQRLKKKVIFVVEKSYSMDIVMGGRTALDVAIDNFLEICSSHIKVGDVSISMIDVSISMIDVLNITIVFIVDYLAHYVFLMSAIFNCISMS